FADGTGASAQFNAPTGIAVDNDGNVFVADYYNNRIRKITPAGVVTTFVGNGTGSSVDGTGTAATSHNPRGIAVDGSGTVYFTDESSDRIRRATNPGAVVTTIAGANSNPIPVPGSGHTTTFNNPTGLTIDNEGIIYQAELGTHNILKLTPCSDIPAPTISGSNVVCSGSTIQLTSSSATGNIWNTGATTQSITVSAAGTYSVLVASNGCASPTVTVNVTSATTPTTPTISGTRTITSGGNTTLTSSSATNNLWSNGATTQSITVNSPGTYTVSVIGGVCTSNATATVTRLYNNYSVSVLAGSGTAGFNNATGTAAQFYDPWGICKDAAGNFYTTDPSNARIRKITPAGVVTTFAGSGTSGNTNGIGTAASFNGSVGIASDNQDNLYVTEYFGHSIRKITPAGVVSTLAGGTGGTADGTGAA
ncbi:MAG: hypothetical protein ACOVOV_09125, partial [Dolichospermum sp.]